MSDEVVFTVIAGSLTSISVSGHGSQLTADQSVTLNPITRDLNQNMLATDMLRWFVWDATSPTTQPPSCFDWGNELTSDLQANGFVWEASTEGTWKICSSSGAYQAIIEVTVTHGIAAVLSDENTGGTLVAGASLTIQITATDGDGNSFPVEAFWSGNAADFTDNEDVGSYDWAGTVVGNHSLTYTHDSTGLTGTWTVTVTPSVLASFEMQVTPGTAVFQQQTITVDITAFDGFGNEIPVPFTAYLDKGNELHRVTKENRSQWTVYMLAEGSTTITVVAENVHVSQDVTVQGNLLGFFEAGGWLYYLGAALGAFILIGIIVVLVVLLRRAGDEEDDYDDYFEEEEDEYVDELAADSYEEPTVEEAGYGGVEEYAEEDVGAADPSITVDEDGTEWWEDEEGVWWYKSGDMEDWAEWEE